MSGAVVMIVGVVMMYCLFADPAEYRGAETDHESGDWSDQLEERGNQVQEKRAVPRRPGVSQPSHVTERYVALYAP